jgi:hypothetical protein
MVLPFARNWRVAVAGSTRLTDCTHAHRGCPLCCPGAIHSDRDRDSGKPRVVVPDSASAALGTVARALRRIESEFLRGGVQGRA